MVEGITLTHAVCVVLERRSRRSETAVDWLGFPPRAQWFSYCVSRSWTPPDNSAPERLTAILPALAPRRPAHLSATCVGQTLFPCQVATGGGDFGRRAYRQPYMSGAATWSILGGEVGSPDTQASYQRGDALDAGNATASLMTGARADEAAVATVDRHQCTGRSRGFEPHPVSLSPSAGPLIECQANGGRPNGGSLAAKGAHPARHARWSGAIDSRSVGSPRGAAWLQRLRYGRDRPERRSTSFPIGRGAIPGPSACCSAVIEQDDVSSPDAASAANSPRRLANPAVGVFWGVAA